MAGGWNEWWHLQYIFGAAKSASRIIFFQKDLCLFRFPFTTHHHFLCFLLLEGVGVTRHFFILFGWTINGPSFSHWLKKRRDFGAFLGPMSCREHQTTPGSIRRWIAWCGSKTHHAATWFGKLGWKEVCRWVVSNFFYTFFVDIFYYSINAETVRTKMV